MIILGIETSCDETAAAVLEFKGGGFRIISSAVASSVELQARYGGVVPEVAARKQMEYIGPILERVLKLGISNFQFLTARTGSRYGGTISKNIDYIAVTNGPGLITSLRVGVEAAKTLSYIWKKPLIAVNHLEGHIYSSLLAAKNNKRQKAKGKRQKYRRLIDIKFPAIALIVSGGHTELILMKDYLDYKVVGRTLDDAAGEAFDKVAKILNLGYPGGPVISMLAEQGDKNKYKFPRPMLKSGDDNFSFAGLKTAVLYETLKQARQFPSQIILGRGRRVSLRLKNKKTRKQVVDICASFQEACVDVLIGKTIKAAEEFGAKTILLGGGVAANGALRKRLGEEVYAASLVKRASNAEDKVKLLVPELEFTGDNAVMIALAGYFRIKKRKKRVGDRRKIGADPNLDLR